MSDAAGTFGLVGSEVLAEVAREVLHHDRSLLPLILVPVGAKDAPCDLLKAKIARIEVRIRRNHLPRKLIGYTLWNLFWGGRAARLQRLRVAYETIFNDRVEWLYKERNVDYELKHLKFEWRE